MPKREDIHSILIIGAGPIVIGQGCEFDYSGVQACKALKEEGYRIILINSNPATVMTDPELCDATYIEPITVEYIEKIIEHEKPDALLPTMGGQTALNCAMSLATRNILQKHGVKLIGASQQSIKKAENRELFRNAMQNIGLEVPKSKIAKNFEMAKKIQKEIGFPVIIRPSFTLGGSGGGVAYNDAEFQEICIRGFAFSPTHELLIEESLLGWKEYELEVVRDRKDNCIVVCTIENIDPMGIHTGDSITVTPAQTLTDKEYQKMRNAAIEVLREIGVETGGANVQFAVHPSTGRLIVIEMNPRVSRSSALASKATGFPIAKVAAKLAIGYTLDELKNEITQSLIPSSFEPTIDYVVTKIPRFNFEKFPDANDRLSIQMKSVGEVMAIGRTFQESLQKGLCALENECDGFNPIECSRLYNLYEELSLAGPKRLLFIAEAFRQGFDLERVQQLTRIDPWFLIQIQELISIELFLSKQTLPNLSKEYLLELKQKGFSDKRLATVFNVSEKEFRMYRQALNLRPVYKRVDSCGAEFPTDTAYLYSTYEEHCEAKPSSNQKILILGSGPNRIGQGIEFDYCCVHAALTLREYGYETIMVNCNPETVSTDYDISDRLYFEPLTLEHVLEVVNVEKPLGVIVQYGGQTPLKLTRSLVEEGVPLIGTSADSIECAEDRQRFSTLLNDLGLKQPQNGIANSVEIGLSIAKKIGFPLILRPSYVLGGHAMEIVYSEIELKCSLDKFFKVSVGSTILIEHFLKNAIEVDVDAVSDGKDVFIGGIMEHIEYAGVHSGDSICSLPPFSLSQSIQNELKKQMIKLTLALRVVGPVNAQFAIQGKDIYVIEVNPRASRTVPFVSKSTGISLPKIGVLCMLKQHLSNQKILKKYDSNFFSVKFPTFPFDKFLDVDPILGPAMKSTGEIMGIAKTFDEALVKCIIGLQFALKRVAAVFLCYTENDLTALEEILKNLLQLKYKILACKDTAVRLRTLGVQFQIQDPSKLNSIDVDFIIAITDNQALIQNMRQLRINAQLNRVHYISSLQIAQIIINELKDTKPIMIHKLQVANEVNCNGIISIL